jgi:hypothetical protein
VKVDPPSAGRHLGCVLLGCGFELAEGRRQDRVERKAARRTCPTYVEVA